jgi:8-amino-7-oxononanoate synthase
LKEKTVIDFTSALYLGVHHASHDLHGWSRLTTGKPAALEDPPGAGRVESQLAALIGCERALLATSTLHVFWDLFTQLAKADVNIFLDAGTYPIVRWGVEVAGCSGTFVQTFRQHDPQALRRALEGARGKPPVIVTDGYCPGCGRLAPIAEYLALAVGRGGFVVIDDSQAMGIFGRPAGEASYGTGGGGSMQRAWVTKDRLMANALIVCSSLAKAFGVPAAVLAGSEAVIDRFENESKTRVHCSPPSAADVAACSHMLEINLTHGDHLRQRLSERVKQLREGMGRLGLIGIPGFFPVQPIRLPPGLDALSIHEKMSSRGVSTILHRGEGGRGKRISFIVTAQHTRDEIDATLTALRDTLAKEANKTRGKDQRSWPTRITTQGI